MTKTSGKIAVRLCNEAENVYMPIDFINLKMICIFAFTRNPR
jgi:hypothetical protein